MRSRRNPRAPLAALAVSVVLGGFIPAAAWADARSAGPDPAVPAAQPPAAAGPDTVPDAQRTGLLGADYRRSGDLAWTTSGDAQGFHLLTARERDGYAWQTTATLSEPGFDADSWIGNACVTGSGKRAVVVYAPRTFTNEPQLMARGGFTAVVDLATGAVTKLDLQASLSRYNPGCGVGETAVLTQSGGEDKAATRLFTLDTATGRLSRPIVTAGQVTSSVPAKDGSVVGASGGELVRIDAKGARKSLLRTEGVPYQLTPDADGGIVFLDKALDKTPARTPAAKTPGTSGAKAALGAPVPTSPAKTRAKRISAAGITTPDARRTKATLLAEGPLTDTGLTHSAAGTVYLTGTARPVAGVRLPRTFKTLGRTPRTTQASTLGEAALTDTRWADGKGQLVTPGGTAARPVAVKLTALDSGRTAAFTLAPGRRSSARIDEGDRRSPALTAPSGGKAARKSPAAGAKAAGAKALSVNGTRDETVESERICSVPRNDPRNQAMQPKPRQVEWAVDMAIQGLMNNHISRPANWKNLGMPAYQPQSLFPRPVLDGGGLVPAQVMLGVTAQESNMWQASRVAVPGVTANPLIGNYYGIDLYDGDTGNDWDVNWAKADCGYGITQVTDHMRLAGREGDKGGTAWDYQKQRAVALDYTANVAAGLQILVDKWNTTRRAGLTINNGNPARLENWTFALWAYNSGFHENTGSGPWGVGWANNPANPEWDAGRSPFMENAYGAEEAADAAHPQDWPYQEKVLGFAGHPPSYLESPGTLVPAFRAAWWNGTSGDSTITGSAVQNRAQVKPPETLFCTSANQCDPARISDSAANKPNAGPCSNADYECWWHESVQWKTNCDYSCGNEFVRFPTTWAEEPDGTAYPPVCTVSTGGLPSGAMVIDDVPAGTPSVRPNCDNAAWTNQGTFAFDFGNGETDCPTCGTKWPAKVDLHQLGAGFGGHFYFGHTRKDDLKGQRLKTTGTWTLNNAVNGAARVWVHLPDHGAQTRYAQYTVYTSKGERTRLVDQKGTKNRWVSIGAYMFNGKPKVSLSTLAPDGTGEEDIAFDAVAVQPVTARLVERSLTAASIFDPNQDLNSNMPSEVYTPLRTMTTLYNWGMGLAYMGPRWDNPEADRKGITAVPPCTSSLVSECAGQHTYDAAMRWFQDIRAGGHAPTADGSAPAMSIPVWMAMSNKRPDPSQPASVALANENSYKIKSDVDVSFLVDDSTGKIIPGSESTGYRVRVGNAHLPHFLTEIMTAIQDDYGISKPYIDYTTQDALEYGHSLRAQPFADGDTPGQAYFPHLRSGRLNSDNTCVDFQAIGGGVHGYRSMISNGYVNDNVKAWMNTVQGDLRINQAIKDFAGDVYSMFFKNSGSNNVFGSQIGSAPPIWQDISAAFCVDGSVKPMRFFDNPDSNPSKGIVIQSYMPDLYLYVDDKMTDNLGRPSSSPIRKGDWRDFSNIPGVNSINGNAFGTCDVMRRGNGGNPWGIDPPVPVIGDGPSARPGSVVHCESYNTSYDVNTTP
ncbi:hypothetical protein [Streptomyces sp. NPDC089919]|uniref:golvesin C-terminal-like domain-containing protein n=1 Tax=Streptomyces sp. NPDC089919 TaxID=3155188 RepID=UPI0034314021